MNTLLHELPPEHPDRNRPLVGCFYCPKNRRGVWLKVLPTYKVSNSTFNELDDSWALDDWCWAPNKKEKP